MTNRQPPSIKNNSLSWLSLLILFITYAVFGWSISQASQSWVQWIVETGETLEFALEEEFIILTIHLIAAAIIVIVSLCLTIPMALITLAFQKSLGSDLKAFISVFVWSFILVLIICAFEYFADLLVMISAALLVRLDLQKLGCKNWQIFLITVIVSSLAFALGIISFDLKDNLDIEYITEIK